MFSVFDNGGKEKIGQRTIGKIRRLEIRTKGKIGIVGNIGKREGKVEIGKEYKNGSFVDLVT